MRSRDADQIDSHDECGQWKLFGSEGAVYGAVYEVYEARDVEAEVFDVGCVDDDVGGSVCEGWECVGCEGMRIVQTARTECS